jgi:hypothetical protein
MRDIDLQTGIIETFHKDSQTGKIQIHKEQDVKPFLEANKASMALQQGGFKGDMHKMASIPPIVLEMWREDMKKTGYPNPNPLAVENRKYLLNKLNDPAWNFLRTKQGVI